MADFTPAEIIADARRVTNDWDTGGLRDSDTDLLRWVNGGIKETAVYRPQLFSTVGDMICTTGQCEQAITFADALSLIEVLCIHGGTALTQFDRRAMDLFSPSWRSATPGQAEQWAPLDGDPLRFFLDKPAPAGQTIDVRYARNPADYALTDIITDLPPSYKPALVDYVIYRSQSKDDPHVLSARALAHRNAFLEKIGVQVNAAN